MAGQPTGRAAFGRRADSQLAMVGRHQFEEVSQDGNRDFDRLLHEMQGLARNQRPQADHDEERPTCD